MSVADVHDLMPVELAERLVALRRDLHQFPELSMREERTAARIQKELESLSVESVEAVAGTGLIARVRGRDCGGPVVAVRGDIDALPIHEETGLPFASQHEGVMHACGHDVHGTWAVGAAALLAERPAVGDVIVILQPGEETSEGALAVLASGALDDVQAIFGGHVDRRFAIGEVVVPAGPIAASSDTFDITLTGRGAHGARPHEGADPVVALGALIGALQTIVSRRIDPAAPAVVTIGKVHAGTAPNVIPREAVLSGTLRAVDGETRKALKEHVRAVAEAVAQGYGVAAEVAVHDGTPPIVNPEEQAGWAREAVGHVLGDAALAELPTLNMGAEDFAFYMERIPGCFLRIGAREPGGAVIPAHTPNFYAGEASIFAGAAVLAECARVASARLRNE